MKHAIEILEAARDNLVSDEMTNRDAGFIDAADECFRKAEDIRQALDLLQSVPVDAAPPQTVEFCGGVGPVHRMYDDLASPDPADTTTPVALMGGGGEMHETPASRQKGAGVFPFPG